MAKDNPLEPKFSTKEEVIRALTEKSDPKGFKKYILLLEHRKISSNLGLVKGELLHNNKIVLTGKMTQFPETQPESFNWEKLKIGESYFEGYSLDYKGETISQLIIQGLKRSVKEGRFPFGLRGG